MAWLSEKSKTMNNGWSDKQIEQHQKAADLCCRIILLAFDLIKRNKDIDEYEVQQFIVSQLDANRLVTDGDQPIVAFRENTSFVHYFPDKKSAKKIDDNSLIMIDLWARLDEPNAPYADITWMAWCGVGDVPTDIKAGFGYVVKARNAGLAYIKKCLSSGKTVQNRDLAKVMEDIILASGLQEKIPHGFGHSLGLDSPHGGHGNFFQNSDKSVVGNVGYTIEPGIYIKDRCGFRSEVDFYVNSAHELVTTTVLHDEIIVI